MKLMCTCQYCGHEFDEYAYSQYEFARFKCSVCGDRNIKVVELKKLNVFGYEDDNEDK